MRRRLLASTLLALSAFGCRTQPERPRNLLIVSVDTLRADAIGASGYAAARTPAIDRLAAEGTYFTAALSTMPRTTPALGSLLTGLFPHRHGSREVGDAIRDVPTLAELLGRRGFRTLAVSANSTAGPKENLHRGFEEFVTYEELIETYGDHLYRDLTDVAPDNDGWATAVTREGLRLLDSVPSAEPFFLWLFYFDPHLLYRPPAPWQDVAAERCWELYESHSRRPDIAGEVFVDRDGIASRALEDCRRLYDAEVAYTDHEIGRFLAELEARGRASETLVVFTADHGENFGEGGLFFEHGDNAHDAGLRVPLIWKGPGVARGRRDGGVVSLVDVVPTALAMMGIPPGEFAEVDGSDLSDRLREGTSPGPPPRSRIVFAESASPLWNEAFDHLVTGRSWWRVCINGERFSLCEVPRSEPGVYRLYDHEADPRFEDDVAERHPEVVRHLLEAWKRWPPESARERTARTVRFKLVQYPRLEGGFESRLYDLESDPGETVDVSAEHPEVFRHLCEELERWSAGIPAVPEREYDPEQAKKLRALGYAGGNGRH